MKKKSTSQSAFFNLRILTASVFCLLGIAVALFAQGNGTKQTQQTSLERRTPGRPGHTATGRGANDRSCCDEPGFAQPPLRRAKAKEEERRLTRYPFPLAGSDAAGRTGGLSSIRPEILKKICRPAPKMPGPLLTFEGIGDTAVVQPPDSEGDVGPNHYIEAINATFKVFDKTGNTLSGPTTYNSFFSSLTGTPCANAERR